jgi:signal transduction histidine kinase
VELTRDLHENAIQRLFGVALALGSERGLSASERRRCQEELRSVVGDLRHALTRPVATPPRAPQASLTLVLERLLERRPDLKLEWEEGVEVPPDFEAVAQSVLAEALRNADRHSQPSQIEIRVASDGDTFSLAVENDGAGDGKETRGSGLGLRLAALEALRYEGLVEFGAAPGGRWRVRLVVPVAS